MSTAMTATSKTSNGLRTSLRYSSLSERTSILKLSGALPAMSRARTFMTFCAWPMPPSRFRRAIIVNARLLRRSSESSRGVGHRNPQVDLGIEIFEAFRSHADDVIDVAAQLYRTVEGGDVPGKKMFP